MKYECHRRHMMIYNGVNCHVFFVVENRGWQECKDVAEERKRIAVISFIKITIGTFLYAAGISLFLDPNSLAPGGAVGISIILNRLTGIGTGTWYLLINIPVLMVGQRKLGNHFIFRTLYVVVINTIFTNGLSYFEPLTREPLLAAFAGSILLGTGMGTVFKCGATTGGMDIVVKLLRKKYKHIKTGSLFLTIDVTVVAISALIFRNFDTAMYALITVAFTGRVIDFVLYGGDEAKLIFVVSDKSKSISSQIIKGVKTGVTLIKGQGAYSNKEKNIIMCVVRKQVAPKVLEIVKQEDEKAFIIVSSATETFGEGYKDFFQEQL